MAQPFEEYIRFQSAKEAIRNARSLKDGGDLAGAIDMLCTALERTIRDTDEDMDDLQQDIHDLDGRVG